mmetsp:Transcript_51832/g.76819  ORF Transcript_51832/g.76819 Transcript_51832/m.76819 type:complete len:229 (+) Transcript_51832:1115-1801(+)
MWERSAFGGRTMDILILVLSRHSSLKWSNELTVWSSKIETMMSPTRRPAVMAGPGMRRFSSAYRTCVTSRNTWLRQATLLVETMHPRESVGARRRTVMRWRLLSYLALETAVSMRRTCWPYSLANVVLRRAMNCFKIISSTASSSSSSLSSQSDENEFTDDPFEPTDMVWSVRTERLKSVAPPRAATSSFVKVRVVGFAAGFGLVYLSRRNRKAATSRPRYSARRPST